VAEPSFEPLYDAVALGMWAYTRSAFRVQTLGRFKPRPGLVLVCAHRAETDVPLICPSIYGQADYLRDRRAERIHFAARDDMFDRGFFAGFPERMAPLARRLLYPLRAGAVLPRVRVHPVPYPSASVVRLGCALEWLPRSLPLGEVLSPALAGPFRARAAESGRAAPATVGDVLDGTYADLLWDFFGRDELDAPALEAAWDRRHVEGVAAVRRLVELVRSRRIVLIFPEGWPSPDGALSPFQPGLATLVRIGRPAALQPVGVSYDRLTTGRPLAIVVFGPPTEPPPPAEVDRTMRRRLARSMPLTCGPVVAAELAGAAREERAIVTAAELESALERAVSEGHPADAVLATREGRRSRLTACLRYLAGEGLVEHRGRGELRPAFERVLAHEPLMRAARERASVVAASSD
jgi:1-acyl-sn-glycerol-3-phosphate acyltransferase